VPASALVHRALGSDTVIAGIPCARTERRRADFYTRGLKPHERESDEVHTRVGSHWGRLDPGSEHLALHQQLAAAPDSLCAHLEFAKKVVQTSLTITFGGRALQ
jgi:hypothetical protein